MSKLRVAILHYHLRGGGVTRIIEHSLSALHDHPVELCVITGEEPPEDLDIPSGQVAVVPGLSYGENNPQRDYREMGEAVVEKATEKLGGPPDVWHVHNHSLGKNAETTKMVLWLAERQHRLLLHIHDFAEDNRAGNYRYLNEEPSIAEETALADRLYPTAPNIHYAVLNGRDYEILLKAGLDEERLHMLSNPVSLDMPEEHELDGESGEKISGKVYLYPCRVIPRKNIGEFVLWSALAEQDEQFAVTLAPKNPKYHSSYKKWKAFVHELELPVTFEAGEKWGMSFPALLHRADAFITTSIAEGFGLIYLESWLAGKPLVGRLLPDIVSDFKNRDISFPGMYDELLVPVKWLGRDKVASRFEKALRHNLEQFGLEETDAKVESWLEELLQNDRVDFGKLDDELQREVIVQLYKNPDLARHIQPSRLGNNMPDGDIIQANKQIVEKEFSLPRYAERLVQVYRTIQEAETLSPDYIQSGSLLKRFQSPQNFSLLRV